VAVKVYRVRHKSSANGFAYKVAWASPAGRQTAQFADEAEALEEARTKAAQIAAGRVEAADLTREDRDAIQEARRLCGDVPVLAALAEWKRVRELTSGHAIPAAEAWAARNANRFKHITVADAVERFIAAKQKAGKQGERTYRAKLKPLVERFPDTNLHTVEALQYTAYLEQFEDGVTRNDLRKRTVALCRWAQKSGYLPRGVQLEIEQTDRADEKPTEIGIINAGIYSKLLEHFRARHPEHLAALVLAGFCGIRSDEIHGKRPDRSRRQVWEDVHLGEKYVRITVAKKNTPAWRHVGLCDAAVEWLMLCPDRSGPVCREAAMEQVRSLAAEAKFVLPPNCFRHSFITYKCALSGDKAAVASEAGNSVAEIDRRYRVPVTKPEAVAWFAVRPASGSAKVIRFAGRR
jgi:hypothetical protein